MLKYACFAIAVMVLYASMPDAHARGGNGLRNYCAWYAQKARAAGRKGKKKQAEAYWQRHRECMRGWG
ncbi:MAG: hypothetical protein ACR2OJ_01655 [Hyphomicrobiales bacterium]